MVEQLDLDYFKVHRCGREEQHNFKRCVYFHNELDRRRDPRKWDYGSELCPAVRQGELCAYGDRCDYAHTKVEQAYHPSKYRNKFCINYPANVEACPYSSYCSYAHHEDEIRVELIHNYKRDVDFYVFFFKTYFCPYSKCQDRSRCVYAHNWQDFRRSPNKYGYVAEACPNWDPKAKISNYEAGCPNGLHCQYCHGTVR